jgi:hypothetical protein
MEQQHDVYIVRPCGEQWAVYLDDQTLGTFDERVEAIHAAVLVAESSGRFGRTSGVLSQDEDGDMLPIWQVDRDAYSKLM